jgi:DNA-binding NarL/FixJ family response regulator
MQPIKLLLVDDHQIVRDGIKSLLADAKNIEVIAEVNDAYELFKILKEVEPDIVMIDISMPKMSGIEAIKHIQTDFPKVKCLILSMHTTEDFIFNAIKAGAKGYLPKNTSKSELIEAIEKVSQGEEYFSEAISTILLKSYIKKAQKGEKPETSKEENLSERELEILKLFAEGFLNSEIAEKLFLSIRTIESHKNHILRKLEMKSTVDLVKFAIRNKIIEI